MLPRQQGGLVRRRRFNFAEKMFSLIPFNEMHFVIDTCSTELQMSIIGSTVLMSGLKLDKPLTSRWQLRWTTVMQDFHL